MREETRKVVKQLEVDKRTEMKKTEVMKQEIK